MVMEFLARVEASGFSTWVRESRSLLAFPLILSLHTLGLGLIVGSSVVLDLRILGCGSRIPLKALQKFFSIIWLGFALNATTGVILLAKSATTVTISGVFWTKMTLIVLAVLVARRIKRTVFDDPLVDQQPVTSRARALALASILLWAGAITAGRLMAYVGASRAEAAIAALFSFSGLR
jgi:hypothetical protein